MSRTTLPPAQPPRPTPTATPPTESATESRLPPQDLEAEAALLGAMLLDRDSIGLVIPIIPREESSRFYRVDHRILYQALIDLYDLNKPIDIVVLEDELRRRGKLEDVGGRTYLIELSESVPSAANIEHYARIVRDKSLLRDLILCSREIAESAMTTRDPASEVLDDAEKRLFDITEQRVANQPVSVREFLDATFRQIESFEEGTITGVTTGFLELDHLLGGMQHGDMIVIAARPSMGKTALGISMLDAIGIANRMPVAFFSLEMSRMQVAQRLLCSHARVNMQKLRHQKLNDEDIARLHMACGVIRDCPVFVDDSTNLSVMELRAKTRRLKMLHEIKAVFVDYLQLMSDRMAAKDGRQNEIAAISRGLKAIGRELNIPIIAFAQLNRQVEEREGNRPRMSDLRESGAIEQDADVVILLHREEYYLDKKITKRHERGEQADQYEQQLEKARGKAELIVAKQRNGPTGVVELHFTPHYTRFDNAAAAHLARPDETPSPAYQTTDSLRISRDEDGVTEEDPAPF